MGLLPFATAKCFGILFERERLMINSLFAEHGPDNEHDTSHMLPAKHIGKRGDGRYPCQDRQISNWDTTCPAAEVPRSGSWLVPQLYRGPGLEAYSAGQRHHANGGAPAKAYVTAKDLDKEIGLAG